MGIFDPLLAQLVDLADGRAVHPLHHHHPGMAVIPEHFRHHQQVRAIEIAAQLGSTGRLAHQVKLVLQMFFEFRHHLARLEAFSVSPQGFDQAAADIQQVDILVDQRRNAGAQDFYRCAAAILEHRKVNLSHRSGRDGDFVEFGKHLADRPAINLAQHFQRLCGGERRHAILQLGQLVGNVERAPGRAGSKATGRI